MAKVILKIPYIKNGGSVHKSHMVNYIATRDGVEVPISHKENYVDYIATRPRVEKISSHGLFNGSSDKINLAKVSREIAEHEGNVWTPIISLTREDAERTGYDNAESWRLLLTTQAMHFADALKIPHNDFVWFGAYHDEGHHPHVHMICYNKNPRREFLTKQGIEKIKSSLVNQIFAEDLLPIYAEKTLRRDELKKEVAKTFVELQSKLSNSDYTNPQLESLIMELNSRLKNHKGKKQYGYLQPRVKNIVDEIVDQLCEEPNIKKAYDQWCDLQDELICGYSDIAPPRILLSQQKEFKSVKNMIIGEVDGLTFTDTELVENGEPIAEDFVPSYNREEKSVKQVVGNLLYAVANLFNDNSPAPPMSKKLQIDSKALRKLREQKQARGLKHTGEDLQEMEQTFN